MDKLKEINFKELTLAIVRRWWLFLSLSIIFAMGAYYFTDNYITPVYKAETVLFIGQEPNDIAGLGISIAQLQLSSQLIVDYAQIAKTRLVLSEVINNLNLSEDYDGLRTNSKVETISESRLVKVSYTDIDPIIAADVANELAKQLTLAVVEIVGVENIRIIDKAIVPEFPVSPSKALNTIAAFTVGLVVALLIVLIGIQINNVIETEEDIEILTDLPVLGMLPKYKQEHMLPVKSSLASNTPLLYESLTNAYTKEAYKILRTNINYMNIDKKNQVIMFTSSETGEGKSTTISSLAISIAQMDKKVLLIDGDLRRPEIHRYMNLKQSPGLTNLLANKLELGAMVQKVVGVKGLDVLSSGTLPPSPAELLGSASMENIVKKARDIYDIILIDAPPVLLVADALLIMRLVDSVILVVATKSTSKDEVVKSKKALEKINAKIMGVVMTKVKMKKSGYYVDESNA